jgi:hypothetical protein
MACDAFKHARSVVSHDSCDVLESCLHCNCDTSPPLLSRANGFLSNSLCVSFALRVLTDCLSKILRERRPEEVQAEEDRLRHLGPKNREFYITARNRVCIHIYLSSLCSLYSLYIDRERGGAGGGGPIETPRPQEPRVLHHRTQPGNISMCVYDVLTWPQGADTYRYDTHTHIYIYK